MTTCSSLLQCRAQELTFPVNKYLSTLVNPIVLVLPQEICQEQSMKSKGEKGAQRLGNTCLERACFTQVAVG